MTQIIAKRREYKSDIISSRRTIIREIRTHNIGMFRLVSNDK